MKLYKKTGQKSFTITQIVLIITIGMVVYLIYNNFWPKIKNLSLKQADLEQDLYDKTYTSKKLGVSFSYNSCGTIKEIGNSIYYLPTANSNLTSGHRIEVFDKSSNMSLIEAIDKNLLQNSKCYSIPTSKFPEAPTGWDEVEVLSKDSNAISNNLDDCSRKYSSIGRARVFWMNSEAPNKFLFLDMGNATLGCNGTDVNLSSIKLLD